MRLLDLFAGIGGFSLAAHWMGWQTSAFVEWDKFCQKVLTKNFPGVPIYDDIREFDGTKYRGQIDLITGGFPCQPFSAAGKQKGKSDDRYLFPEMLRVINEVRPTWIVAENVRGLLSIENGEVLSEILSQLESSGYKIAPCCVPASAVEAPHQRQRLWIVCHLRPSDSTGRIRRRTGGTQSHERPQILREAETQGKADQLNGSNSNASNAHIIGQPRPRKLAGRGDTAASGEGEVDRTFDDDEPEAGWREPWPQVAARLCRMDDGVSAELDEFTRRTDELLRRSGVSPHKKIIKELIQRAQVGNRDNRVNRLKALGNSIVPQIAYEIFKSIEAAENE
jgi:DNA (cytosine-5)-methyltransferase 1